MLHRPLTLCRLSAALLGLVLAVSLAPELRGQLPAPAAPAQDPGAVITAESLYNRLQFLASDGLRGRDTPSLGLEAAAAYLVSEHRRAGLEPAGENGTFYQRYPFRRVGPDLENVSLEMEGTDGAIPVRVGENAFVRGGADGLLSGDLVFLGNVDSQPPETGSLQGRVVLVSTPGEWGNALFQLSNRQARFAQVGGAQVVIHVLDGDFPSAAFAQLAP